MLFFPTAVWLMFFLGRSKRWYLLPKKQKSHTSLRSNRRWICVQIVHHKLGLPFSQNSSIIINLVLLLCVFLMHFYPLTCCTISVWNAVALESKFILQAVNKNNLWWGFVYDVICHVIAVILFAACTDKELRNLASRLKDWFGSLHEDANRVIKPTSSDSAQGSKMTNLRIQFEIYSQVQQE